jgi:hypothetical protein
MALFSRREKLVIGFLILTGLVIAIVKYIRIHGDIAMYHRGELLRVIDEAPP